MKAHATDVVMVTPVKPAPSHWSRRSSSNSLEVSVGNGESHRGLNLDASAVTRRPGCTTTVAATGTVAQPSTAVTPISANALIVLILSPLWKCLITRFTEHLHCTLCAASLLTKTGVPLSRITTMSWIAKRKCPGDPPSRVRETRSLRGEGSLSVARAPGKAPGTHDPRMRLQLSGWRWETDGRGAISAW